MLGTNTMVEIVAFPSSFTLSRTLALSLSGPSHQEICAAGREPTVWHWNSAFEPAANTSGVVFPLPAATAVGLIDCTVGPIADDDLLRIFTVNGRTVNKE